MVTMAAYTAFPLYAHYVLGMAMVKGFIEGA